MFFETAIHKTVFIINKKIMKMIIRNTLKFKPLKPFLTRNENYSHRKLAVEPIWGFMKVILGFTQVSARSINKVKGKILLMVLNIKKNSDSEI